ncbi:MAG TPA: 16S rRNA (cytosine(967)-C(5))-methyltransferase RsmB [Vicinamibacterales bacterium]|nr:16S rRNA (cytosine(967)-C(5))-methyltransferase RsmB [Vicinamibacterales bacterium]
MSPARWAAYQAVAAVREGTDLAAALARARDPLEDRRDRALAGEIALGVFRWRAALDHAIGQLAKRNPDAIDPPLLDILRVAAYQILHLERVPAAAAVNDAVNMARRAGRTSAAGFVNGVLRALTRQRNRLPFPQRPDESRLNRPDGRDAALDYLSITLSHPRWLAARWLDRYGFDAAEAWARFNNTPAALTLRANRLRGSRAALSARLAAHAVSTEATPYAPDGLIVRSGNPLATPLAGDGSFVVQDEASQLVAEMVAAASGERILDACAAPGGKTTALAAAVGPTGLVVAADFRSRRLDLLAETVRAAGADRVHLLRSDLRRPLPFRAPFDAVLVDVPCSGLGTIRRDPDIRWRRTETDLASLAKDELIMLREAARAVRPGGRLIYATCSSEPEENESVVSDFLVTEQRFARALPQVGPLAPLRDASGALRTLPHLHNLEAFYAAILVHLET